jgi:hypothetical protein
MDGQGQGGGNPEQMVQMVAESLGQLAQMAAQTSPELAKGLQGMQQQFMQLIEQAMQGGGAPSKGGAQPVQDQQGQGMPQGPQGAM